jgi:hypothetical protein
MAKFLCCRLCFVETAAIELADGSTVLLCATCDMIGLAHEVALGGPVWAAQMQGSTRRAAGRKSLRR